MLAQKMIWQEHEYPQDDNYVPKDGQIIAWSLHVVKASQYKVVFVVKVGIVE